jgi:phage FluMu protein Com
MTSATPIKFRCFQCNKLLGVSRSKVGAVVACPQCRAELIVPEPPEESPPPPPPNSNAAESRPSPPPAPPKGSSSSSRIEPAVVLWDTPPEPEPIPAPEAPGEPAFPAIQLEPISLRPDPPVPFRGASRTRMESRETPTITPAPEAAQPGPSPAPSPQPIVPATAPEPVLLPSITLAPTTIRDSDSTRSAGSPGPLREVAARRNDVILPRTAVVLWSFLVLLGMVFAFASGLLVGRFLWARGVPVSMPTGAAPQDRGK